ncbi:MAG: CsbD family protein [Acidimicrobiales bacterium]|nr:CsbD family protein [Acidimicrobiales bacterium]
MNNADDAKGKIKEAAGDLTGNDNMKREGKVDQITGSVKDAVDAVKDKVEGVLHRDK